MELDIYLPKEQLAFEYQGEHHFHDIYHMGTLWQQVRKKDKDKRKACKENEITLIEVPYWWDMETPSLVATIHKEREDLIPEKTDGTLIPMEHSAPSEGLR
jgi:hypothetical protein